MDEITRRELLRAGLTAGLGLAALGLPLSAAAAAYTPGAVKRPARISGLVRYRGKARRPKKVKFSGDCTYCRRFDLREEALLVGQGGALRNVALALKGIRRGKPLPAALPVLAERRCTFEPHVLTVAAGSKIVLHNDDPVLNTFHAIARPSGRTLFNIGTPRKGQKIKRRIKPAGLVEMRCDVHPWEIAYIVSVPHPYHAVSDAGGAFALDQIPPGEYTLALWHEQLGVQQRKVRLGPGQHLKLQLAY